MRPATDMKPGEILHLRNGLALFWPAMSGAEPWIGS